MEELSAAMMETEEKEILIDDLMNHYGQDVLKLVYSYVRNKELAEDLTQDIFVKCYKSLHTYKGKSALRTWLWRIAINHCKDYVKSWYYKNVWATEEDYVFSGTPKETVEQEVIKQDEDERLLSAVMDLPIVYREVIFLFYYEERSIKEIAEVVQVKQNTVKTRLRRAKELMKQGWEG
ncbi:sigma-70 family RNA polymerase sigma factor [Jeotgalibacillus proteolyticus]|uniref:sigma-70 family RNA polymerase sigma factor n=1 Tax=Jeotgalibacillus proteolyticus TaxID=2082395 RepID=UPI003CF41561